MNLKLKIEYALASNEVEKVFSLLDEHLELINEQISPGNTFTFLIEACLRRHEEIVLGLIERGANVNQVNAVDHNGEGNNSPLWFACQGNVPENTNIVRALIKHGADVNAKGECGYTPLHMACQWGHVELAKILIEHGADQNALNDAGQNAIDYTKGKVGDKAYEQLSELFID